MLQIKQIDRLQDAVAQLPVNLCSIDLVVRLIKAETLTSDWLRLFVIRSLVSCENVKEDRETMERQVSLVGLDYRLTKPMDRYLCW